MRICAKEDAQAVGKNPSANGDPDKVTSSGDDERAPQSTTDLQVCLQYLWIVVMFCNVFSIRALKRAITVKGRTVKWHVAQLCRGIRRPRTVLQRCVLSAQKCALS